MRPRPEFREFFGPIVTAGHEELPEDAFD